VNGDPSTGYYSYDIGGWHIIALNAECGYIHGCDVGSTEEKWLAADLADHPSECTMAYWHQPRWADGNHTSDPRYDAFWQDLYAHGAELVLNGHEHMYERFAPQTPAGLSDPVTGITQIIAGTGGEGHAIAGVPLQLSLVRDSTTFGVLQVTLHPDSYEWNFAPAAVPGGGTFTEQGATMCHGTPS
jgi:Calcineurin-like phosphoesterase.